jgi:hypothetical protein
MFAALGTAGSSSYFIANGISGSPGPEKQRFTTPAFESENGPGSCGKERWSVKTLTDIDAGSINFTPVDAAIAELGSVPAPTNVSDLPRQPQEEQVFRVQGSIVAFKLEADSDIHVAIADPAGDHPTMIAEFPASICDAGAVDEPQIDQARQDFIAAFGQPTGQFHKPTGCAVLAGVFFFDRIHGQFGVAPNGAELHPVLSFEKISAQNCSPPVTPSSTTTPTPTSTTSSTTTPTTTATP